MALITIFYEDGNSDEVSLNAVDYVKAERHFKGSLPTIEGTLYAAWRKLRPGSKFDEWLNTVDRMDNDADDDDEEDDGPLAPAPSPEP